MTDSAVHLASNDQQSTIGHCRHPFPTLDDEGSVPQAPLLQAPLLVLSTWRHNLLLASLLLGFFLSVLDTTIVSVALTTIADQFHDFERSSWAITAYLLTYMAFAIIISRLSDHFGCGPVQVACLGIFIACSVGCARSQNMTELIIFRAFQGLGGSGLYTMLMVISRMIYPSDRLSTVSSLMGLTWVFGGVLGPILSGAITRSHTSSDWRWIFYLNIPTGGIALLVFLLVWPRHASRWSARTRLISIDVLGCILLLAASVLMIFSLEEAGASVYAWNSGILIVCLTISGATFSGLIAWQYWLAQHPKWPVKVIFPVSVVTRRVVGMAMLTTVLFGFDFYSTVVFLPQRFQIIDGDSPLKAGIKLLPMMGSAALGSICSGRLNTTRNLTGPTLVIASAVQLIGYGLMITLGSADPTPKTQYGFQVFLGFGFGAAISSVTMVAQLEVPEEWKSVTQGAMAQMRSLGGCLGLAIAVIVFNDRVRRSGPLHNTLTEEQLSSLLKSPLVITTFTPQQQVLVARVYAHAFTEEMTVATYIAAACFVCSLLTLTRHPAAIVPKGNRLESQNGHRKDTPQSTEVSSGIQEHGTITPARETREGQSI